MANITCNYIYQCHLISVIRLLCQSTQIVAETNSTYILHNTSIKKNSIQNNPFKHHPTKINNNIPGVFLHSEIMDRLFFTFITGKLLIISSGKSVCVEDVVVHLELAAQAALLLLAGMIGT